MKLNQEKNKKHKAKVMSLQLLKANQVICLRPTYLQVC